MQARDKHKEPWHRDQEIVQGELEQIHGPREAADFIARGKYEECEDSDGDICYKKVQTVETDTKSFVNEAEVKGSCRVDDAKAEQILSAMDKWFTEEEGSAILDGKVRKRPASAMNGGVGSIMGEDPPRMMLMSPRHRRRT